MKLVTLDQSNVIISVNCVGDLIEAPDNVECGWHLNGETWEKGAALLAREATEAARVLKRQNVTAAVATLRAWKVDATAAESAWDGWATAQRFTALKTVTTRFGTLCDKMADLVEGFHL